MLNNIDLRLLYIYSVFIKMILSILFIIICKLIIKNKARNLNEIYTTYIDGAYLIELSLEEFIVSSVYTNIFLYILLISLFPVAGGIFIFICILSLINFLKSLKNYDFKLLIGEIIIFDLEHIFCEHKYKTYIQDDLSKCLSYTNNEIYEYIKINLKKVDNPYYLIILKNFKELINLIKEQEEYIKYTESKKDKDEMVKSISNAILKFKSFLESINDSMPSLNKNVFSDYNLLLDSIIVDIEKFNLK